MIPILLICIVAMAALVVNDLLKRCVKSVRVIAGGDMLPTLRSGRRCVSVGVGRFTRLRRGDIVCITRQTGHASSLVKRIIAIPGDAVVIGKDNVRVNGLTLSERYLAPRVLPYPQRVVVLGADEYWVMGDNRDAAIDSRHYGPVKRREIKRKLLVDLAPCKRGRKE